MRFPLHPYIPTKTKRGDWHPPKFAHAQEQLEFGAELFSHEYYWEAHEVWEELWKKELDPEKKIILQVLVLCAAFLLKEKQGEKATAQKIKKNALQKLKSVDIKKYPWAEKVFSILC